MRKAESGFTLIELIVVIVILGILAVTAAAKFMNLSSDATASVVKGLAGALRSSSSMVYAKAPHRRLLGVRLRCLHRLVSQQI